MVLRKLRCDNMKKYILFVILILAIFLSGCIKEQASARDALSQSPDMVCVYDGPGPRAWHDASIDCIPDSYIEGD